MGSASYEWNRCGVVQHCYNIGAVTVLNRIAL